MIDTIKTRWQAMAGWQRWAVWFGLTVAAILAVNVGGPLERRELQHRLSDARANIDRDAAIQAALIKVDKNLTDINAKLGEYGRRLARPSETPLVLQRLATGLEPVIEGGHELTSVEPTEYRDYGVAPLSLRFAGDFNAVARLVHRIEHEFPWSLQVDHLLIDRRENDRRSRSGAHGTLATRLDMRILMQTRDAVARADEDARAARATEDADDVDADDVDTDDATGPVAPPAATQPSAQASAQAAP